MITAALERLILAKLHDASPCMVAEPELHRNVNAESPVPVKRTELRATLEDLANRNEVFAQTSVDFWKWKISPNGIARLQELNLAPRIVFPARRTRQARDE